MPLGRLPEIELENFQPGGKLINFGVVIVVGGVGIGGVTPPPLEDLEQLNKIIKKRSVIYLLSNRIFIFINLYKLFFLHL